MRENFKRANCHPERQHAAHGLCFECYSQRYPKAKRAACHPGRVAKFGTLCRSCYDRDLKQRNPEYAERQRQTHAKWAALHTDRVRNYQRARAGLERVKKRNSANDRERLLFGYGLTWEDEHRMLIRQNFGCGICGSQPSKRFFDLDHDHRTGKVRGLLCHRCNKGLGLLGDSEDALRRALSYMQCSSADDQSERG